MIIHRCEICDYTAQDGSALRDRAPSKLISVGWSERYQKYLCWECFSAIDECRQEFIDGDEVEGRTESPALPVRDE